MGRCGGTRWGVGEAADVGMAAWVAASITRLGLMEGCWVEVQGWRGGGDVRGLGEVHRSMGWPASIPRWRLIDASVLVQAWGARVAGRGCPWKQGIAFFNNQVGVDG